MEDHSFSSDSINIESCVQLFQDERSSSYHFNNAGNISRKSFELYPDLIEIQS